MNTRKRMENHKRDFEEGISKERHADSKKYEYY